MAADAAEQTYAVPGLVRATDQRPLNNFVTPMLTDMYQITMTYAYWRAGKANDPAVFDMFFRKNPFNGEYTIFAGLDEAIKLVQTFKFTPEHIAYLRTQLPECEDGFWTFLSELDCSSTKIYAVAEGTVVFPRIPLVRIEGPLAVGQLLETPLLNTCNYASLVTTNAARHRRAAGKDKVLLEFGLRRAQGPDGAMSASRYSYMGGFHGTSNVLAGLNFGIKVMGTHAHALVSAYTGLEELTTRLLEGKDVVAMALQYRSEMGFTVASNGELAAFISFAQAFPNKFLALVDTYDTLSSGVPNFICVALSLIKLGHKPLGIRLDSGDLAYLSKEARRMFRVADEKYGTNLAECSVVASNDINEAVLNSLNDQGHDVDVFGIGTNLVTCQAQPALGMVYKLVEVNGVPRIKLSQEVSKVTLPGAKEAYRLIGGEGVPLLDLIIRVGEPRPQAGKRVLCRHPFDEKKRAYVTPTAVIPLLRLVWKGAKAPMDEQLVTDVLLKESAAASHGATAPPSPGISALTESSTTVSAPTLPPAKVALAAAPHVPPASAGLVPVHLRTRLPSSSALLTGMSTSPSPTRPEPVGFSDDHRAPDALPPAVEIARASSTDSISMDSSLAKVITSPSVLSTSSSWRAPFPSLDELRAFVTAQLELIREDHLRPLNPTPYKVSVSSELFHFIHDLWMKEVPILELS